MHRKSTASADCCDATATYEIVWADDARKAKTCLEHFGWTYDQAQSENDNGAAALFLTPHVSRVGVRRRDLVPA